MICSYARYCCCFILASNTFAAEILFNQHTSCQWLNCNQENWKTEAIWISQVYAWNVWRVWCKNHVTACNCFCTWASKLAVACLTRASNTIYFEYRMQKPDNCSYMIFAPNTSNVSCIDLAYSNCLKVTTEPSFLDYSSYIATGVLMEHYLNSKSV